MSDPNQDMLLDALRRVGVRIPELRSSDDLVSVRSIHVVEERKYWHITNGTFDTYIDKRDASTEQDAQGVAFSPLQPWYYNQERTFDEIVDISEANRDAYLEWLRRGVK